MAGFTYFSSGIVNNKTCFIPIEEIISKKYSNRIQPHDRAWQRLLASTGQPSFLNDKNEDSLVQGVAENK
jgi:6-phosphofructokinase 1